MSLVSWRAWATAIFAELPVAQERLLWTGQLVPATASSPKCRHLVFYHLGRGL